MSEESAIVRIVLVLTLAFCGGPDLHDAAMRQLMNTECEMEDV